MSKCLCIAVAAGIAFKEGLCYGKFEAAALFFVTPLLLLGHLTGWVQCSWARISLRPDWNQCLGTTSVQV